MMDTIYLEQVARRPGAVWKDEFPFTVPAIAGFETIRFSRPVTFFIGENGSGKSTLLEAMAAGLSAVAVGSHDLRRDRTLAPARKLGEALVFSRKRHAKQRMFFRAEDAFGFTNRVINDMEALEEEEADLALQFKDGSYAQQLATGVVRGQRRAYSSRYGENPDGFSHGEVFLSILKSRIVPGGLYLLDEPETPLSPARILALISLIKAMVAEECQFIIATHSPILMAFPGAEIMFFEGSEIGPVAYQDTEHVRITRTFLNDPERYLRQL
ncbi:MAG: AAA family ATPase [Pseudomonadota bacterium]